MSDVAATRRGVLFLFFFFFFFWPGIGGYVTGEAGPSEGDVTESRDAASALYPQLGHVPVFTDFSRSSIPGPR